MIEERMRTPADVALQAMVGEHGDLLRHAVALAVREAMEAEVAQMTGAGAASAWTRRELVARNPDRAGRAAGRPSAGRRPLSHRVEGRREDLLVG
jgi:hypothetical protein